MRIKKTLFLALAALMTVAGTAWAAIGSGTQDDPIVLENGATVTLPGNNKAVYAKFVVPQDVTEDGVCLVIDGLSDTFWRVDTDAACSSDIAQDNWFANNGSGAFILTIPVAKGTAAGTTYYIYETFCMNPSTVTVSYGSGSEVVKQLALESVTPAESSVLSAANSLVTFKFNCPVKIKGAQLSVGEEKTSLVANVQGSYVSIEPKTQLLELYKKGAIKAGDALTVTLLNVAATDGTSSLGDVTAQFVAAAQPVMLTSMVNTPGNGLDTFLSWFPEDDPTGLVQLVFDGDLDVNRVPTATLEYGDLESDGDFYSESLPVKFFGTNILAVDLRGKLRTPATMKIASGTAYPTISLTISGVYDAEGNYTYSDGSGSLGSYGFVYNYQSTEYSVYADFTPVQGSSIDGVESIEIWVNEEKGGHLNYSGVQFAYTDGGVAKTKVVPASQISSQPDTEEATATIITVPVPEFSRDANSTVVVSFAGLSTPDGLDHSADLTATYTTAGHAAVGAQVESAVMTSADGSVSIDLLQAATIEKLIADGTLVIATSMDSEIGVLQYQVVNVTTGDIIKAVTDKSEKTDEGHWEFWIPIDYKLYAGNTYELQLKGWSDNNAKNYGDDPIFTAAITLQGAMKAFEYSAVTLVEPAELLFGSNEPNFTLTGDDNSIQFVFSGAVRIKQAFVPLGFGITEPCEVQMSDDNTTATILISDYVLSQYNSFMVSIQAEDMDGKLLKGNNGEEENTFFSVYVETNFGLPEVTMTAPVVGMPVEKFSTLTFSHPSGIAYSNLGKIEVMDMMRNVVATAVDYQVIYPDDKAEYGTEVVVTLDNEVATTGFYSVVLPQGVFNIGSDGFSLKPSAEAVFTIEVKNDNDTPEEPVEDHVSINPAAGNVTEIPALLILTFEDQEEVGASGNCTLVDDKGQSYRVELGIYWDGELNQLQVELKDGAITADGVYTLTIPAGAASYGSWGGSSNQQDIVFVYTIGASTSIAQRFVAEGGKVTVYDVNGVQLLNQAAPEALNSLAPGKLYIINGKKVIIRR